MVWAVHATFTSVFAAFLPLTHSIWAALAMQIFSRKHFSHRSWSQGQDSHQCCLSQDCLGPQAQRPMSSLAPVCITLGKSSNISVPQVSSCKWSHPATRAPVRTGTSDAPGQGQKSRNRWARKQACKMFESCNSTIPNRLPNVTAKRTVTYIRHERGFIWNVVS